MKIRNIIYARQGMALTDGRIYGKEIYLAEGVSPDAFREITEAEYEAICEEQMKEEQL